MSCDNAGVALPANSASVSLVLISLCAARSLPPASTCELAGVEGFEPPNGGIKTRCLTTWRHPKKLGRGRHPLSSRAFAERHRQRRAIHSARDKALPFLRHPRGE